MIKVSVIVPVYNVQDYLRECLDSIVNQTLKDIEIICVNDGSTDKSLSILEEYAKTDDRFIILSKSNSGYGHTINTGMSKAKGEYVIIVESDDIAFPDMLQKMCNVADTKKADIVRANYYDYDGSDYAIFDYDKVPNNCVLSEEEKIQLFDIDNFYLYLCRRDFFVHYNIKLNETPGASYQDISYQFQLIYYADRIILMSERVLHYRVNREQSSINNRGKIYCICDEYNYIFNIIKDNPKNIQSIIPRMIVVQYKYMTWNCKRIAREYRFAFIERWQHIFQEYFNNGYLNMDLFTISQQEEVKLLLSNAENFMKANFIWDFYEDVISYKLFKRMILPSILKDNNVVVFGTGSVAKAVAKEFYQLKGFNISTFMVSTADRISDKNTIVLNDITKYDKSAYIIITVKSEQVKEKVVNFCTDNGYYNLIMFYMD